MFLASPLDEYAGALGDEEELVAHAALLDHNLLWTTPHKIDR
jgi:hypothetical protein